MKCPKCGYLGFEQVDRCRNCGYDFSLTPPPLPDFTLRSDNPADPLPDGELALTEDRPVVAEPGREPAVELNRHENLTRGSGTTPELPLFVRGAAVTATAPSAPRGSVPVSKSSADSGSSAPLPAGSGSFSPGRSVSAPAVAPGPPAAPAVTQPPPLSTRGPSDEPLIAKPSAPRQPLAVRRSTPDLPRLRGERRATGAAVLDTAALDASAPPALVHERREVRRHEQGEDDESADIVEAAGLTDRLLATLIDIVVLAATDLVVVYFTLQICGLSLEEIGLLPRRPLLAFFVLQNGAYLVGFTAAGQTLGKMAAGIRVVATATGGSPHVAQALARTLAWVVLAAPAGLGFMSVLFSRDGRGLHDRAAGTRVVRVDS